MENERTLTVDTQKVSIIDLLSQVVADIGKTTRPLTQKEMSTLEKASFKLRDSIQNLEVIPMEVN